MVSNNEQLINLGFRVPRWMLKAIREVQNRNHLVTRTEAARLVLTKGLESLGINLPNTEAKEESA